MKKKLTLKIFFWLKIFTRRFHSLEHFSYSSTSSVSLDYPPLSLRFPLNSAKVASTPLHTFTHAKFPTSDQVFNVHKTHLVLYGIY